MRRWCYSCGLRCAGGAHEIGRDSQTEETTRCEIVFSFISVLLNFPHLHLSSELFHRAAIESVPTAGAPSQTRACYIGAEGIVAVAEALRENSTLEWLNFVRM